MTDSKKDSGTKLTQANEEQSNITLLPPPSKKIALHNPNEVRREMCDVYRSMKTAAIAPADGTKLVYVLGEILKAYKVHVQDEKLEAIEIAMKIREQLK